MKISPPVFRAALTFGGFCVLIVFYEFWFEPKFIDVTERFSDHLEHIALGIVGALAVVVVPTIFGVRDHSAVEATKRGLETAVADLSNVQASLFDAMESISEAFVQFDPDGRLVRCNQRYCDLYGYSHEEAAPGTRRQDLAKIDVARGVLGPPERAEALLSLRRAQLTEGLPEIEFQLADGRWLMSRTRSTADGGFVSIQSDITALKQAQAAQSESENRLTEAIESLEEGFVYFDADDRLVLVNERYRQMYPAQRDIEPGMAFEEVIRKSLEAREVPAAIGHEEAWLARRMDQHRRLARVDEQHLADGSWIKISERRTADGGTVGLRTDITAQKENEIAAESANHAKTMFLAHMSHELRTPLNSIIGFSEIIRGKLFGGHVESYTDYADNIHSSGIMLLALINDILDISKIEANELAPEPAVVDLPETVRDCLKMVRTRADQNRISLHAELAEDATLVYVDPLHVRQILLNLLSNGVKFTPEGGNVRVLTRRSENGEVVVNVIDDGIGISQEDQFRLFEPFAQIGNAMVRSQEGTGLGLTLVKSFAELNGGRVELTSALGEGTTISVYLPAEKSHGPGAGDV